MKTTKAVSRVLASLLCAILIFQCLPLNAAGSSEEVRREAFLRGGDAISVALNTPAETPAVSKSIAESVPRALPAASAPAPTPAPVPVPQAGNSKGLSKAMWVALIGGFAASGAVIYWAATGPGASIRNCSTCSK